MQEALDNDENTCADGLQAFDFDRVFGPEVQQTGIFEDVSQLVTSALDGYNVCIFAYGQTGKQSPGSWQSSFWALPSAASVRHVYMQMPPSMRTCACVHVCAYLQRRR